MCCFYVVLKRGPTCYKIIFKTRGKTIKQNSKFNVEMNNSFYDPKISINKNHLPVVFSVELRKL